MSGTEPRLEVHRIGWNWYRYHIISPPDVNVMGHGTRRWVREAVSEAIRDAGDPEHLRAYLITRKAADSGSSQP